MTFLNQFHKEAMERTMRKIEESEKSPMSSKDFADYMRRNLEKAKAMEAASKRAQKGLAPLRPSVSAVVSGGVLLSLLPHDVSMIVQSTRHISFLIL